MMLSAGKDAQADNGKASARSEPYAPYREVASRTLELHRKGEGILTKLLRGLNGQNKHREGEDFQSMLQAIKAVDNNAGHDSVQRATEVIALYDVPSGAFMIPVSGLISEIATTDPSKLKEMLDILEKFAGERRFGQGVIEAKKIATNASNTLAVAIELRAYEKEKAGRATKAAATNKKPDKPAMYN